MTPLTAERFAVFALGPVATEEDRKKFADVVQTFSAPLQAQFMDDLISKAEVLTFPTRPKANTANTLLKTGALEPHPIENRRVHISHGGPHHFKSYGLSKPVKEVIFEWFANHRDEVFHVREVARGNPKIPVLAVIRACSILGRENKIRHVDRGSYRFAP